MFFSLNGDKGKITNERQQNKTENAENQEQEHKMLEINVQAASVEKERKKVNVSGQWQIIYKSGCHNSSDIQGMTTLEGLFEVLNFETCQVPNANC